MADHFLYEKYEGGDSLVAPVVAPVRGIFQLSALRVRILALLSLVLVAELVWFCIIVPLLPLASIRVNGTTLVERGRVLAVAGIDESTSWFMVNRRKMEERISSLAEVEAVSVSRRFPDTLTIDISERTRVAFVMAENASGPLLLSLDREGVLFSIETPVACLAPAQLSAVPLLSGLVFEHPAPGTRLPPFLSPLMRDLSTLVREVPALLRELSEIRVESKDGLSYELVLCPVREPVRFKTGALLNRETLTYMMFTLDILDANGIQTDEVDLRTGTAVYVPKEEGRGQ